MNKQFDVLQLNLMNAFDDIKINLKFLHLTNFVHSKLLMKDFHLIQYYCLMVVQQELLYEMMDEFDEYFSMDFLDDRIDHD